MKHLYPIEVDVVVDENVHWMDVQDRSQNYSHSEEPITRAMGEFLRVLSVQMHQKRKELQTNASRTEST